MMSQRSKQELVKTIRPRYLKADRTAKTQILTEFIETTGYHRKYAIRLLKHGHKPASSKKRPGRRKTCQGDVVLALKRVWEVYGFICSKRLHPFMAEGVTVLERCGELEIAPETKQLLLKTSRATIDRCLKREREVQTKRGLSTTKPGSLLKSSIPIQTYTPWEDERPGFLEIDLVAHCGLTTEGTYLCTLTATDIATGWTECMGVVNKTQTAVSQAIKQLRQNLPFPLLGLDSDNGSEFINNTLLRYCREEQITFTRSRPYQKNDQAHVEQKNWNVVRLTVGYQRMETEAELDLLAAIYADLRLYVNFFQPALKLISKERIDGRTIKKYDPAKTPFRRTLAEPSVGVENKAQLMSKYVALNPVTLRTSIDRKCAELWKLAR